MEGLKAIVDRYPAQARIEIYYDPSDPANAFLETGTSGGAIFLVCFGSLFVGLALLGIVLMLCVP